MNSPRPNLHVKLLQVQFIPQNPPQQVLHGKFAHPLGCPLRNHGDASSAPTRNALSLSPSLSLARARPLKYNHNSLLHSCKTLNDQSKPPPVQQKPNSRNATGVHLILKTTKASKRNENPKSKTATPAHRIVGAKLRAH